MTYFIVKDIHNILRWLVVLSAFWAIFRAWSGLLQGATWSKKERIAGIIFSSSVNLQLLIGIVLIFVGPIHTAYSNMGATMKDSTMRFFAVEHPFMMILAAIVAQVGFSLSKRSTDNRKKFLFAAICYTVAALLIAAGIPWKLRPLLPSFLG